MAEHQQHRGRHAHARQAGTPLPQQQQHQQSRQQQAHASQARRQAGGARQARPDGQAQAPRQHQQAGSSGRPPEGTKPQDARYAESQRARTQGGRPHAAGQNPGMLPAWQRPDKKARRRMADKTPAILLASLIIVIAAGGLFLWLHRSVSFTLDGSSVQAAYGSTLDQIRDEFDQGVTPGNLVSVNGNVITQGGGTQLSAKVDGQDLSEKDAEKFRLAGGETIELSNGTDKTEDVEVQSEQDVQPKLETQGSEGAIFYVSQWGKPGKSQTVVGKQSGETATVVTQEPQDCIVTRHNVHPDNDEKLVALTFDDGPSEYTDKYLDILDQYGVKATFNMCGNQIEKFTAEAQRVANDGHELASHTWDHKQLTTLSADEVQQELNDSFDAIKNATGVDTTFLRPPYGSINAQVWLASGGRMSMAAYWTQDSEDWRKPGADAIVANATAHMYPGSIILMHDGGGNRDEDVEALPKIIEAWQNAGYRFVTMSELMSSDSSIPREACSSQDAMPGDAVWPTELADGNVDNGIA